MLRLSAYRGLEGEQCQRLFLETANLETFFASSVFTCVRRYDFVQNGHVGAATHQPFPAKFTPVMQSPPFSKVSFKP